MYGSYVSIYTNYSMKRLGHDNPPAHNSNNCSYKVNKTYKPQQGKVDNRPPHKDLISPNWKVKQTAVS